MKNITITVFALTLISVLAVQSPAQEKSSPAEVVEMTHKAVAFLTESGDAGLKEFDDRDGRWVWKNTYAFVMNCETGDMIAHPVSPHLKKRKLLGLTDVKGNLIFVELCEAAKKTGGGWAEYWWNQPGEKKPSRKITFIQQVPNTPYQVGAGIYEEAASVEELKKLTL